MVCRINKSKLDPFDALFQAILENDPAAVKQMLAKDKELAKRTFAEPYLSLELPHWIYRGDTALHASAAGHHTEICRMLLDAGADFSAAKNHRASQPLHYAADGNVSSPRWNSRNQVATLKLLVKAGAKLNARDKNGATPLHRAVRTRCADAVEFLLGAGADAGAENNPGSTPFHLAVQNTGRGGSGNPIAKEAQANIIRSFLKFGVKPTLTDARGRSVLDWARSDWIRELLLGR